MNLVHTADCVSDSDKPSEQHRPERPISATSFFRGECICDDRATDDKRQRLPSAKQLGHSQTLVEFAFILPLFLLLMLAVVQMILVGGAALAVNQAAVTCGRYASLNPTYNATQINSYLTTAASPLINDSGLQPIVISPTTVPRTTGSAVSVTVTYSLKNKLFLGSSFFGVTFPTQVSVTHTTTSE
jgi:TadE-like protein